MLLTLTVPSLRKLQLERGVGKTPANNTSVELPKLDDVRGAFTIVSSKSINETCSTFDSLQGENNVIKGDYVCQGETETSTSDQDGTSTGNKPKKSSGAANPMLIPGATGVLGLFAAMFGLL